MFQEGLGEPLDAAQGHRIREPGLVERQGIQNALGEKNTAHTVHSMTVEQPGPHPRAETMRDLGLKNGAASVKAHHPVVAIAERKDHASRKELFPSLVEDAHALQQLALLSAGDGQQLLAVAVSGLQIAQQGSLIKPALFEVSKPLRAFTKGPVPDFRDPL